MNTRESCCHVIPCTGHGNHHDQCTMGTAAWARAHSTLARATSSQPAGLARRSAEDGIGIFCTPVEPCVERSNQSQLATRYESGKKPRYNQSETNLEPKHSALGVCAPPALEIGICKTKTQTKASHRSYRSLSHSFRQTPLKSSQVVALHTDTKQPPLFYPSLGQFCAIFLHKSLHLLRSKSFFVVSIGQVDS